MSINFFKQSKISLAVIQHKCVAQNKEVNSKQRRVDILHLAVAGYVKLTVTFISASIIAEPSGTASALDFYDPFTSKDNDNYSLRR